MEELTIGQITNKLLSLEDQNAYLSFDWGGAYPKSITSSRGYYDELCIEYSGNYEDSIFVKDFVKLCQEAIGKTYTGWKGGEYTMDENTPVWVACSGCTSNTKICDIVKSYGGYKIKTIEVED